MKRTKEGTLREVFRLFHANACFDDATLNFLNNNLDEVLSRCPLKIAWVYHDNQGRISGFRFESLKIDGTKFAPTANDVMNAFAKWLVEEFGEPHEK